MIGSRKTMQKEIIFNTVKQMKNHPTAEEIYFKINGDFPNISKATVYRNLGLLALSEKITKVSMPGEPERYDYRVDYHHHLKCESCQNLIDVEIDNQNSILDNVINKDSLLINSYKITFSGLCNNCLQNSIKEEK